MGEWSGKFRDFTTDAADTNNAPDTVTGVFSAFSSNAKMVGPFGTDETLEKNKSPFKALMVKLMGAYSFVVRRFDGENYLGYEKRRQGPAILERIH